jgi:hypothetical protein
LESSSIQWHPVGGTYRIPVKTILLSDSGLPIPALGGDEGPDEIRKTFLKLFKNLS